MALSKKELEEEIQSIKESIEAHEAQMKMHTHAIKVDSYLKELLEKDLKTKE